MTSTVTLRPATLADEPAIRACAEAAYARYIPAIGRRPAPMDADFARQIVAGQTYVAQASGQIQGYLTCYPDGPGLHLESVAVLPSAAGQGIGKALIAHCEGLALAADLPTVHLYTNAKMAENLTLYPHLGYRQTDRRTENGFDRVYFSKLIQRRRNTAESPAP